MYLALIGMVLSISSAWQEGFVITNTDTLSGRVSVNLESDIITIRNNLFYDIIYAKDVKEAVAIEDNVSVKYIAAEYGVKNRKMLFKVISDGELTLLYRKEVLKNALDQSHYPDYHVMLKGSIILSLETEKDVLKLMKGRKQEIQEYLSTKIFYVEDTAMLKELFDYYNSIQ